MPTVYFPSNATNSGVDITYSKTRQKLCVSGWYDSCVGIEPTTLSLREFFDVLGITEKDCRKAWENDNAKA